MIPILSPSPNGTPKSGEIADEESAPLSNRKSTYSGFFPQVRVERYSWFCAQRVELDSVPVIRPLFLHSICLLDRPFFRGGERRDRWINFQWRSGEPEQNFPTLGLAVSYQEAVFIFGVNVPDSP